MSSEGEATFSAAAAAAAAATTSNDAARGAGGKLKRQTARRHPSTPYSRPPQNQVQQKPWISRIVDPAYRIISGSATRLLPYFFSNAASAPALTAPNDQDQQNQDNLQEDPQGNDPSVTPSLNKPEFTSIEEGGTSGTANVNESSFNTSAQTKGKRAVDDVVAVSELERLMEGKTFSRAETDRLIEILNSRAVDLPDAIRDERMEMALREEAKKNSSFLDKKKESIGGKEARSELWATPTPHAKSIVFDGGKLVRDEAGLSPAELAKAFMGGQTSSSSSQGFLARNEKNCLDGGIVGNSAAASPSNKPSACWPGIKRNEQSGFVTPKSQRESFGLQNLPRTPYSRTILSSSKSQLLQLQDKSSKRLSTLQSPSQSAQTRYGKLTLSKGGDGGIFGPNRRSRQSATMSPYSRPFSGKSRYENSAINKSSESGESNNLFRSHTTSYGKHKESEVGTPTVPAHSTQVARTILDKLGRTQPTPKDKSAELKLATSWRYPQASKTVEQSISNIEDVKKDGSDKSKEDIGNIFSHNPPSSVPKLSAVTTSDTQNAMAKTTASESNGIFSTRHETSSSGTTLQYNFGKPEGSLPGTTHEKDAAKAVPYSFGGEPAANVPKPPPHSLGNNKPTLTSISVAKPFQKWAVPSGSNASFTFPVSSSDGASASEPTTPSIMPFTTSPVPSGGGGVAITSHHHHEARKDDDEIPRFGFDGKRRGEKSPLVFAFPSVSEVEVIDEDDARLGIKFTFGSEKPERISFNSAGSDGVRC